MTSPNKADAQSFASSSIEPTPELDCVPISIEEVTNWFKVFQRDRYPITPAIAASISGVLQSLSGQAIKTRDRTVWKAAKPALDLQKYLPEVIAHWRGVAERSDRALSPSAKAPEWLHVRCLKELQEALERSNSLLVPKRAPKRTPWHVRAAQIEDVITSAFRSHYELTLKDQIFSKASDKPFVKVIALALSKIEGKIFEPAAIADALAKVPLSERLRIQSWKHPPSGG